MTIIMIALLIDDRYNVNRSSHEQRIHPKRVTREQAAETSKADLAAEACATALTANVALDGL